MVAIAVDVQLLTWFNIVQFQWHDGDVSMAGLSCIKPGYLILY